MNEDDGTRDGVTLLRNTGAEGRVSASRVTRRLPPPDRTSALLLSQRNRYVTTTPPRWASVGTIREPGSCPRTTRPAIVCRAADQAGGPAEHHRLSLIHISEPTRLGMISYA